MGAGTGRVIVLGRDGHLAFVGAPSELCAFFGVQRVEEMYERLADPLAAEEWAERFARDSDREFAPSPQPYDRPLPARRRGAGFVRQWLGLTSRTLETIARNRLTLAIRRLPRKRLGGTRSRLSARDALTGMRGA
jgi:ABC transport system ATP-binding/permease protein